MQGLVCSHGRAVGAHSSIWAVSDYHRRPLRLSTVQGRALLGGSRKRLGSLRRRKCKADAAEVEVAREPFPADEAQAEASTSNRCSSSGECEGELSPKLAQAMLMVPFAGLSLQSLNLDLRNLTAKQIAQAWRRLTDTVQFGEILPPIGSQQLSYARFLELLSQRRVKRVILMSDATCALVEIPVEGYASDYRVPATVDRLDPEVMYGQPNEEWNMEKIRYYVELPGDLYEDGYFMDLIKYNMNPLRDEKGRIDHHDLLELEQVHTELQVVDPTEANLFLDTIQDQLFPIIGLLILRTIVTFGNWFLKFFDQEKTELQDMIDEYSKFKGTLYNVEGGKKGTGVSYQDVAGVEHAMDLVQETIEMLLGDPRYEEIGAHTPRGILMEGPPGTGKTFLAKAMAGESGLPFISTNGSEFVEMFQGVAASRVRDLFKTARKVAPAIIFIDEIDAIGKARSLLGGSSERESGLMQILYEMDGFNADDQILIIGATNRADALDDALLRPGRFDRTIHMGLPTKSQRVKILQVHARDKRIPRGGDAVFPEDALLHRVAEITINYSGAELANLLNEAAILMVRKDLPEINMQLIREVIDKRVIGMPSKPLPDSVAKRRLAVTVAARVVAVALTPGLPQLQRVSILPRGDIMSRILFMPQDAKTLLQLSQPGKWNAVELKEPLSPYEMLCGMLVPLYAARAAEEAFYGPRSVTLSTAKGVAEAGQLANYLVVKSALYPGFRDSAMSYNLSIGGKDDPTTSRLKDNFEPHILALQEAGHARALRLVRERRVAIEAVADELCSKDTLMAPRIIEIIESCNVTPVEESTDEPQIDAISKSGAAVFSAEGAGRMGTVSFHPPPADPPEEWITEVRSTSEVQISAPAATFASGAGRVGAASFGAAVSEEAVEFRHITHDELMAAMEVIIGSADTADLTSLAVPEEKVEEVREQLRSEDWLERVKAVRNYAKAVEGAPFPPPPPEVEVYQGDLLGDWVNPWDREPIEA